MILRPGKVNHIYHDRLGVDSSGISLWEHGGGHCEGYDATESRLASPRGVYDGFPARTSLLRHGSQETADGAGA